MVKRTQEPLMAAGEGLLPIARRRRLPSLNALRAFEAAARHSSFRAAADELSVTHSAISHQVKALEQEFGVPLFSRGGREVRLTEEGQILSPILRDAFDNILAGVDLLRRRQPSGSLTVQVYVTLAVKWLLPRLHDFSHSHPDIQVALATSYTDWSFADGDVDAAILLVESRQSDLHYTALGKTRFFPVCAPSLLKGRHAIRSPEDLRHHRLLNVYPARQDWVDWLTAAGVPDFAPDPAGPSFDNYLLALEEAAAGAGVSMATPAFVRDDLDRGRLAAPFDLMIEGRASWYFVCRRERKDEPRIARFRDWILQTVRSYADEQAKESGIYIRRN